MIKMCIMMRIKILTSGAGSVVLANLTTAVLCMGRATSGLTSLATSVCDLKIQISKPNLLAEL